MELNVEKVKGGRFRVNVYMNLKEGLTKLMLEDSNESSEHKKADDIDYSIKKKVFSQTLKNVINTHARACAYTRASA